MARGTDTKIGSPSKGSKRNSRDEVSVVRASFTSPGRGRDTRVHSPVFGRIRTKPVTTFNWRALASIDSPVMTIDVTFCSMMIWAAKSKSTTGIEVAGTNEVRLGSAGGAVFAEFGREVVGIELPAPATVVDVEDSLLVGAVVDGAPVAEADMFAGSLDTRNHRTPRGNSDRTTHSASLDRFTDTCTPAHVEPYRAIDSS
jgi:hypothetical protein